MNIKDQMEQINDKLIAASRAYYNEDNEIMSNYEYDSLFDELTELENKYGILLDNSITQSVGIETSSSLEKTKHSIPMLSLSKTKSVEELKDWAGDNKICASWKLDGLTVVMTYEGGKLVKAATRGDGVIGEDITKQALHFSELPNEIPIKDKIVIRGEAVITYREFNRINALTDESSKFKNPRNLVSGTVKNLNLSVLDERNVNWLPFEVIEGHEAIYNWIENDCPSKTILETVGDIHSNENSYNFYLDALWTLGFIPVEHCIVGEDGVGDLEKLIKVSEKLVQDGYDIPVDGLVFTYDDIKFSKSLGSTSHSPRGFIAFKWQDATYDTTIKDIIWNKSRTGRINPIAVFNPVEIDGTTVSRASLHNITYIEDMKLNIGDEVSVYKANMIIPQIAENKTKSLKDVKDILPHKCPSCGSDAEIRTEGSASFLYCTNDNCESDIVDQINLFLNQMKVMGISRITIEKLYDEGILSGIEDVFKLKNHEKDFCGIEGVGKRLFKKLINQIDNINTDLPEFIASFGIKGVNIGNAKVLADYYKTFESFVNTSFSALKSIDGIGDKTAKSIMNFIDKNTKKSLIDFSKNVTINEVTEKSSNSFITGKNFAVTGSLEVFKNRKELQELIENNGGKVTSVSSKTDYLITNNTESGSSKNKKAKELGVEIISEREFIDRSK